MEHVRTLSKRIGFLPEYMAVLLFLFVSIPLAILRPPGSGLDETLHVVRAAQIADGYFLPMQLEDSLELDTDLYWSHIENEPSYGGESDAVLYELLITGAISFAQERDIPYAFPTWEDGRLQVEGEMGASTVNSVFSNTAVNSPVAYLPHSLAYWICVSLTHNPWIVVVAMRIAGVFLFAAALFLSIRIAPVGKAVFAAFALTPTSIYTNSTVSADTMAIAMFLIFMALVLKAVFYENFTVGEWCGFAAASILMCLTKTTNVVFGLLIPVIPLVSPSFRLKEKLLRLGLIGTVSLIFFLLWYCLIKDINTGILWRDTIHPQEQMRYVINNPLGFVWMSLRLLLNADYFMTAFSYSGGWISASWPTALVLIVCFMRDLQSLSSTTRDSRTRVVLFAGVLIALSAIVYLLTCLAMYLQFCDLGSQAIDGVQTRYFYPMAVASTTAFLLLLSAMRANITVRDVHGGVQGLSVKNSYSRSENALLLITFFLLAALDFVGIIHYVFS